MEYVTRAGIPISVGRVDRRLLDAIVLPEPQPPVRQVETWGGVTESVPVYTDPAYQTALFTYRLQLWREQLNVLATGITLPTVPEIAQQLAALAEVVTVPADTQIAFLRYALDEADRAALVQMLLYHSTVTQQGIAEACMQFDYKWRGQPLATWAVPTSYGERGKLAVEWRAAVRSGLTWPQFCELPGPEQSAHVAFWMLEDKLTYLLAQ